MKNIGCVLIFIFIIAATTGLASAMHSPYSVICDVPSHMTCKLGQTIEIPVKVIDQYNGRPLAGTIDTGVALLDGVSNGLIVLEDLDANGRAVLKYKPDRKGEIPLVVEYEPDNGYLPRVNLTIHVY